MQIAKNEVHELLRNTLQQLKEVYSVEVEELKTRIKVKVTYQHSDSEILLANFNIKKTAKAMQQLIDKLSALYAISEDIEHFFKLCDALDCRVTQSEYTRTIKVTQRYDVPNLKNFVNADVASVSTTTLRAEATQRLKELRDLSELCTIEFSNDMIDIKSFYSALETLKSLKQNYTEHRQTFNAVLKTVAQFVRAANKLTTRDNAEYLRQRKLAKQREIEALKNADYDNVSDETLKKFLKKTFYDLRNESLLILDKSSKHRAVCVAELVYDRYYNPPSLMIARIYLCGIDDNEEAWIHTVLDFLSEPPYEPASIENWKGYTVERAMARIFNTSSDVVKASRRQGDILITRVSSDADALLIEDGEYTFSYVYDDLDQFRNYFDFVEETTEYDIAASHTLKSSKAFKVYKHYKHSNLTLVELTADAVLEHPSHKPIKLEKSTYVFNQSRVAQDYD